jgi:polyphosphate kinase
VYGIVGYKTHAKMLLVGRREGKKLRHYVHLGTGNYHSRTARIYTDYGLLTCSKTIGEDVLKIFNQLTSLGKVSKLEKLLQSPFTLHDALLKMIQTECENAQKGRPTRIEPRVIQALYQASMAGVQIDLIVRGTCSLRPGVTGISDNIRVRSIIGRFLEHTRVFYFENDSDPRIYAASADWMDRNLFQRVETCYPIESKKLRERVKRDLDYYLQDNTQAWLLQSDGSYQRAPRDEGEEAFSAQRALLGEMAENA